MKAAIVGIAGSALAPEEAALFRAHPPVGVILFARNIQDPAGLSALTRDLRRVLPAGAVIMVDQEGGRVARLRPPHWRAHPPAGAIGALFARNQTAGLRAAWLTGALIGLDCSAAGFDLVAAPVLDLSIPGSHDVIGDRAYATDPASVARLARAVAEGLMAGGVIPIGKHAPGHGRARVDSHLGLPRVDANDLDADLLPFAANANLPWFMTAHIVYAALDPISPATLSGPVIERVIRGRMGFRGVLVTDDLAMKALSGTPADLAARALAAGCDVALYCPGDFEGTRDVLAACPAITPATQARMATGRSMVRHRIVALDGAALSAERDRLLA
jgi:beta-N-acetylhexosaminidase